MNRTKKTINKGNEIPNIKHIMHIYDAEQQKMQNHENIIECIYDKGETGMCSVCSHILLVGEEGFNVCPNPSCSVLYTNSLDFSPEWKFFGGEDKVDPSRCGNPIDPLLQESSMSGKIICGPHSSYEMRKVSQWTKWKSMPHKEKALNDEMQFITIMAQKGGISEIFINHAMHIYKDILEQKMFRGINRDGIRASSIYIACRLNGYPRTPFEIANIFNIDKAVANSACSIASDLMHNIERSIDPTQKNELCATTPIIFIERFCSKLQIGERLTLLASFIAKEIEDMNLINDNNPHTIAGGIILFISKNFALKLDKKRIKEITGVSEVSMSKVYKKLEAFKDDLIPKCFYDAQDGI